jgi:hypothetical protein
MLSGRPLLLFLFTLFLPAGLLQAQDGPPNNEEEFEQQYQTRITKDKLNGVYIPKNLDDAMLQLDKLTSPEAQKKIKTIPEDSLAPFLHKRLGQWMIMNWGFYGGSRLSHYLRSAGVTFPDDMADFLLLAYHHKLNGKPVAIRELAIKFKEKRKEAWEKEQQQRKVIYEEVRKKNR